MVRKHVDRLMRRYFRCDVCKQGFQLEHFSEHFNVFHLKKMTEKKYYCNAKTCKKEFKTYPDLLSHFRLKHIEYIFWCKKCMGYCTSIGNWDLHKTLKEHLSLEIPGCWRPFQLNKIAITLRIPEGWREPGTDSVLYN